MRVTLIWPFGQHQPNEVIDCDPTLAGVLVREGFARATDDTAIPVEPLPPTAAEVLAYARANNVSTTEARRHFAAQIKERQC